MRLAFSVAELRVALVQPGLHAMVTNHSVVSQFAPIRRFALVAWASGPQRRRPRRRSFALCSTDARATNSS